MKAVALAVAYVVMAAPAAAENYLPLYGGIIAGEVVCALQRHGIAADVRERELNRITEKLQSKGMLASASDLRLYRSIYTDVAKECPR